MIHLLPKREEGQGLVEYALILVLVAIIVIAVLLLLGPAINDAFCDVTNTLQSGSCVILVGSGDIYNATVTYDPPSGPSPSQLTVTVTVANDVTSVSLSGDVSGTAPCLGGSCHPITVPGVASSGNGTITSSGGSGGSYDFSWSP